MIRASLEIKRDVTAAVSVRRWRHDGALIDLYPANAHETFELAWVDSGALHYVIGRERIVMGGGQALVIPAGVEHATAFPPSCRMHSVHFSKEMFDEIADVTPGLGRPNELSPGLHLASPKAVQLAQILASEAEEAEAGYQDTIEALSEVIVTEVLRRQPPRCTKTPHLSKRMRIVLEFIREHSHDALSVERMASQARLSRYHFTRLFRESTGVSPYRYLQRLRLKKAAALLKNSELNVTEIALSVGFPDLGRFGRYFKDTYGMTPSEYQRRHARAKVSSLIPLRATGR